jgi:UDP-N-acetylmuramate--alanine ligase
MSKIRVGIIFGGRSKEREISFAGGRTVYDNLNKSVFEPIPIFVDSWGNFVLLDWQYIYKGSIRDFFPPVEFLPANSSFQLYAENLGHADDAKQMEMLRKIGQPLSISDLRGIMDIAFLCLHGPFGEDGKIQGLLEYLEIPYTGSGILPSAIGIDKSVQKQMMVEAGFNSPAFFSVSSKEWKETENRKKIYQKVISEIGFPFVVKPANQGSSIGVTILTDSNSIQDNSEKNFISAVEKAFFKYTINLSEWALKSNEQQQEWVKSIADIREGIGLPARVGEQIIYSPDELKQFLNQISSTEKEIIIASLDGEDTVLIEGFIEGKEFSCIVIQDENQNAIALPPTEIRKGKELFDYRSKYLPGLSRKITPIDLPEVEINRIRIACEKLFYRLKFDVYARIDGFIRKDGTIFLNDPNTTSGMMPSSFFFHQAAEIGLNPSQFLSYIIRTSLASRISGSKNSGRYDYILQKTDELIRKDQNKGKQKIKIAVLLGGYSSERHISVESGRNVFEKLSSSEKYEPIPVFLTGSNDEHKLFQIPINVLLKDNADDILEKVNHYSVHPVILDIQKSCLSVTKTYSSLSQVSKPIPLTYTELKKKVDQVFIALHGRPGEDGAVQQELEKVKLSYNGSDQTSSSVTIDKFKTNEILKQNGFLVAEHLLITSEEWKENKNTFLNQLESQIRFPLIAKPVDDGCSSAVKKIKNISELEAFAQLIFRETDELDERCAEILHIKPKEEFPRKKVILIEELISRKDSIHFLEITGGMLTLINENGQIEFEVFEASEALSEGDVLSLEEKFLAGQGQNITPARYAKNPEQRQEISNQVKATLGKAAAVLNISGYCRIDAFVRVYDGPRAEVIFIEVNSLPGMTPATCIFHQAAINQYKPYEFIDRILDFGLKTKGKGNPIPS